MERDKKKDRRKQGGIEQYALTSETSQATMSNCACATGADEHVRLLFLHSTPCTHAPSTHSLRVHRFHPFIDRYISSISQAATPSLVAFQSPRSETRIAVAGRRQARAAVSSSVHRSRLVRPAWTFVIPRNTLRHSSDYLLYVMPSPFDLDGFALHFSSSFLSYLSIRTTEHRRA